MVWPPGTNLVKAREKLVRDIAQAINMSSAENGSNTPDFMLAEYLVACLEAFDKTTIRRAEWYGTALQSPGEC